MAKFEKGNPGGPGRPRGSRNIINQRLDRLAEADAESMVRKMIDPANEGDCIVVHSSWWRRSRRSSSSTRGCAITRAH